MRRSIISTRLPSMVSLVIILSAHSPLLRAQDKTENMGASNTNSQRCQFDLPCHLQLPDISTQKNAVRYSIVYGPYYGTGSLIEITPYYNSAVFTAKTVAMDYKSDNWKVEDVQQRIFSILEWNKFFEHLNTTEAKIEASGFQCLDPSYARFELSHENNVKNVYGTGCAQDMKTFTYAEAISDLEAKLLRATKAP